MSNEQFLHDITNERIPCPSCSGSGHGRHGRACEYCHGSGTVSRSRSFGSPLSSIGAALVMTVVGIALVMLCLFLVAGA